MTEHDLIAETYMNAPLGIVLAEQRIIRVANQAFADMFGYALDEVIGQSMMIFYPSESEFERVGALWSQAFQASLSHDDVRIMKRSDGSLFWVRGRGRSLTPQDPWARGVWSYSDLSRGDEKIELTSKEREVAMLLVTGKSAKEIARVMNISPRTAESHRANLMKKYGAPSTAALIARLASTPIQI